MRQDRAPLEGVQGAVGFCRWNQTRRAQLYLVANQTSPCFAKTNGASDLTPMDKCALLSMGNDVTAMKLSRAIDFVLFVFFLIRWPRWIVWLSRAIGDVSFRQLRPFRSG